MPVVQELQQIIILEMIGMTCFFMDGSNQTAIREFIQSIKSTKSVGFADLYGKHRRVGNSFVNTLLNDNEQDEFRISRGGGYMKAASECKSASRSTNSLHHRFRNLGFRLALAQLPGISEK